MKKMLMVSAAALLSACAALAHAEALNQNVVCSAGATGICPNVAQDVPSLTINGPAGQITLTRSGVNYTSPVGQFQYSQFVFSYTLINVSLSSAAGGQLTLTAILDRNRICQPNGKSCALHWVVSSGTITP